MTRNILVLSLRSLVVPLSLAACFSLVGCKKVNSAEQLAALQSTAEAYCECAKSALKDTPRERDAMIAAKERCEAFRPAFDAARSQLTVATGEDPAAGAISDLQKGCFKSLMNSIPLS
jgi:hypothetical protein